MKRYLKIIVLTAMLIGYAVKSAAQSPCFPLLPVTGTFADPATSGSPNADRVFWLTWGANHAESISTHPYGKGGTPLAVGSKSYGSVNLGGGRYMCIEAEIMLLDGRGGVKSYIPGTFAGDFLPELYNQGGKQNNKMASGIINSSSDRTIDIVIRIKATTNGQPVRLRGMVLADAESLDTSRESIIASAKGDWNVVRVYKNIGKGSYVISKENNASGTKSIVFEKGNNDKTGAVAYLKFDNDAYLQNDGNAVEFSSKFRGKGRTAIAVGLLTSGYDFGDAPESYGQAIHLIDDTSFGPDYISENGSSVDVNAPGYVPAILFSDTRRYLGSTAPDADINTMFSEDALGDDLSGIAGPKEEDAWPEKYKRFADVEHYKPGDVISAIIPYKRGLKDDQISGWIDFNLNGTFDTNEMATAPVPADGSGTVTLNWTVPEDRVVKSTYVRLRYFGRNQDHEQPTGNALNGEVEDHRIYILSPGVTNPTLMNKSK